MAGLIDLAPSVFVRRCCWQFITLFSAVAFPFLCRAQETQAPTIRVDVNRVNVGVVVTNGSGKFIEGLQKSDFHVFDNGVEQPITEFLANDDPAQVVLMLECGPSMILFGKENIQKADALISSLAPNDRVAIVCYSSGAVVQFELSADQSASRMALRELNFHVGSGDLNLSQSLLAVLAWLSTVPGKKTVVLISSGVDSSPPKITGEFQTDISSSDVRVLAVSTSKELKKSPKKHKRTRQEKESRAQLDPILKNGDALLRNLAAATGGRAYFPKGAKEYEKTYAEIAQIVRHEYNVSFAPQSLDGKLHSLRVTAKHGARVDYRQAYLAPSVTAN
jgi:Ca-activated chloride channel family protein